MHPQTRFNHLIMAGMIGVIVLVSSVAVSADAGAGTQANGYYYTVQKGDTLWDLSRRFADSPWVWPQLWTENADAIANPHLIYPGQKIRMTRRLGAPPASTAGGPAWDDKALAQQVRFHYPMMDRVGFIRKEPVAPMAVIFDARDRGRQLLTEGDIVYLKPEGGAALAQGQLFTVYRTLDPIYDKATRSHIGTQHLLLGVVRILQSEATHAVGEIVRSYRRYMKISDKLMPFIPRATDILYNPSTAGIDGTIFEVEEPVTVFGQFHTVFIDRGRVDGIREGQVYSIYRRDENTVGNRGAEQRISIPVDIGDLVVLHVEENNSTVMVTDSKREFYTGARIRTPPMQAQ